MTGRDPADPRWRLLAGLGLGLLLGIGLQAPAVSRLRAAQDEELAARHAGMTLQSFADLVARANEAAAAPVVPAPGAPPEEAAVLEEGRTVAAGQVVARAAALWTAAEPGLGAVRVVDLGERILLASTFPADRERGEPPRPLVREEKPLVDLGQRLRAAVEGNRGGAPPQPEIAVEPLPGGAVRRSALWEVDGAVPGLVQVDTLPPPRPRRTVLWPALFAILLPLALFVGLELLLRGRGWALGVVAGLLLLTGVGGFAAWGASQLAADRRAAAGELAASLANKTERAGAVLSELGGEPSRLQPPRWDTDAFRRPRGEVGPTGVDAAAVEKASRQAAMRGWRASAVGSVLALAVFLLLGARSISSAR